MGSAHGRSLDKSLRVNASSLFCLTRLAAGEMKKAGGGSIINIGSYMGIRWPRSAQLCWHRHDEDAFADLLLRKGWMVNFTRFAASVLGPHQIRVNAIHPGGFQTPDQAAAFIKNYSANTMLGRLANATDPQGRDRLFGVGRVVKLSDRHLIFQSTAGIRRREVRNSRRERRERKEETYSLWFLGKVRYAIF